MIDGLSPMLAGDRTSVSGTRHEPQNRMRRQPIGTQSDVTCMAVVAERYRIACRTIPRHAKPRQTNPYGESRLIPDNAGTGPQIRSQGGRWFAAAARRKADVCCRMRSRRRLVRPGRQPPAQTKATAPQSRRHTGYAKCMRSGRFAPSCHEAETGKAESDQAKRRGFGHRCGARYLDLCNRVGIHHEGIFTHEVGEDDLMGCDQI